MIRPIQRTDSSEVISIMADINHLDDNIDSQTTASSLVPSITNFIEPFYSEQYKAIYSAFDKVSLIENPDMKKEATNLLINIQNIFNVVNKYGVDTNMLPELHSSLVTDDNSFSLELISENYRVGFSLEESNSESAWFLITKQDQGEINASGYFTNELENTRIIYWLYTYIFLHL